MLQQCVRSIHQWGDAGVDGELKQELGSVVEIIPLNQKCGKLLFLGCNAGHINSDLVQAQDRMHLHLRMPMIHGVDHCFAPERSKKVSVPVVCAIKNLVC